jgi:hypothetical protein
MHIFSCISVLRSQQLTHDFTSHHFTELDDGCMHNMAGVTHARALPHCSELQARGSTVFTRLVAICMIVVQS